MRRADRLFQIIQILRRSTRPVTAASLAEELEISRRTVYRDILDLMAQRVPIEGAAGLGYVLASSYDMPPLMLTPDELEVVVLGAQWVASHSDKSLAKAAADVVAKIAAVLPEHLRALVMAPGVGIRPPAEGKQELEADVTDTAELRKAIRENRKIRLRYRSESGQETVRVVWPVIVGFAETSRLLIAWCELRQAFRHFRADRIVMLEVLDDRTGSRPGELRRRWQQWRAEEMANAASTAEGRTGTA